MPKRGENIYKRKDGRWEGRIRRYSEEKGRTYQSVYGKSYHEVKEKMFRLRREIQKGPICCYTMEEAAQLWVRSESVSWKAGTYSAYNQILSKYILPYLGQMPVRQITNKALLEFIGRIRCGNGRKALSGNYMFQICAMIRRILIYMNRQYDSSIVVPDNPVCKKQMHNKILPSETALGVLEDYLCSHCDKDTCLGILIAFHTGIRVGELSALTWKDIDLKEEVIYIRRNMLRVNRNGKQDDDESMTQIVEQKPKSLDSVRVIPLPPCLLPLLKLYQKEETAYVISGVKSPWAEPRTIQYRFENILKECRIEYFNFHMLRHAFATRCVANGLDVKSLSEILGHSNVQITLNLYVHSTIQQKRLLMRQYDAVVH